MLVMAMWYVNVLIYLDGPFISLLTFNNMV